MADFYEVHRKQLNAADSQVRQGECWTIALREPIESLDKPMDPNACVKTVRFIASSDGKLKPATELDYTMLADWKRRHRSTPPDWFDFPDIPI